MGRPAFAEPNIIEEDLLGRPQGGRKRKTPRDSSSVSSVPDPRYLFIGFHTCVGDTSAVSGIQARCGRRVRYSERVSWNLDRTKARSSVCALCDRRALPTNAAAIAPG